MIADLKPYPEYKESGLPWLGPVPTHWPVRRIKTVLRETDCRSADGSGALPSLTRVRGLIPHRDMTDKMHSAKTLVGYKRYSAGQLVMNRMQAWSGMFGAGEIDGLVSPDYGVFDVLGGHAIKLVLERLKTPDLVSQFALESKGIGSGFNRLYTDRFGSIRISLLPPNEQGAIVRFLDWANGRLERAIRAKRRVIALLNEQKQAIIHRAVTRGLDPSVPLRPSGIPWLGDIPQHWSIVSWRRLILSLKDFGSNGSFAGLRENVRYLDHPDYARLVRLTDLRRGLPENEGIYVSDMSYRYLAQSALFGGEFLIANVGAHAGYVCQMPNIDRSATLGPNMMFAKRIDGALVDTAYLVFSAQSDLIQRQLRLVASESAAQPKLDKDDVRSVVMPLPPRTEQERIISQIKIATKAISTAISRLEREIELLREYRTRLVADVVTGKLDVREAAGRLPDEAPPDTAERETDLGIDSEIADEEAVL